MFSEGEVKSPYFLQVWWAMNNKMHSFNLMLLMYTEIQIISIVSIQPK
jgi:hypothetical protein